MERITDVDRKIKTAQVRALIKSLGCTNYHIGVSGTLWVIAVDAPEGKQWIENGCEWFQGWVYNGDKEDRGPALDYALKVLTMGLEDRNLEE